MDRIAINYGAPYVHGWTLAAIVLFTFGHWIGGIACLVMLLITVVV